MQVMQKMTLAKVHLKWSVILMNLLGPKILSSLWMKGQDLHRERAYLKVPGWLLFKMNFWPKCRLRFCYVGMKFAEVAKR